MDLLGYVTNIIFAHEVELHSTCALYLMHACDLDDDHYQTKFFSTEVVVSPPSCYLSYVRQALPATIGVSAQNCYKAEKGAFTGEIRLVL